MAFCTTALAAPHTSHKVQVIGQDLDHDSHRTDGLYTLPSTKLPRTQQAVITPEVGPELNVQYSSIAVRRPEPGEVVVKIAWTGVCRSDLTFSKGPLPGFATHNHIAGHEGIGQVVGSHDPSQLGQIVAARYVASTCRTCWACQRDLPEACKRQFFFPKHHNGTFQEFVTAPWTSMMPLQASGLDAESSLDPALYTAALCSGAAALKALRQSNIQKDDVVLIFGVGGGIGHLAGLMAKQIFGARVLGVDKAEKEKAFPDDTFKEVMDTFIPTPGTPDDHAAFTAQIRKACLSLRGGCLKPDQPDAIIMAASSEEPFQWVKLVRDGGTVSCLGVPSSTAMLSIRIAEVVERQICIRGVMMGGWDESYQVMEYIKDRRFKPIITKVSLEGLAEAIHRMSNDAFVGKLVVAMEDTIAQP